MLKTIRIIFLLRGCIRLLTLKDIFRLFQVGNFYRVSYIFKDFGGVYKFMNGDYRFYFK